MSSSSKIILMNFKAAPCFRWVQGDKPCTKKGCRFAHNRVELVPALKNILKCIPNYKQEECSSVLTGEKCKARLLCIFSHRNVPKEKKTSLFLEKELKKIRAQSKKTSTRKDKEKKLGERRKNLIAAPCKRILRNSICRHDRDCLYTHSDEELAIALAKKIADNPTYKTIPCKTFLTTNRCKKRSFCIDIHGKGDDNLVTQAIERTLLKVRKDQLPELYIPPQRRARSNKIASSKAPPRTADKRKPLRKSRHMVLPKKKHRSASTSNLRRAVRDRELEMEKMVEKLVKEEESYEEEFTPFMERNLMRLLGIVPDFT
jgi:hypothetical protein